MAEFRCSAPGCGFQAHTQRGLRRHLSVTHGIDWRADLVAEDPASPDTFPGEGESDDEAAERGLDDPPPGLPPEGHPDETAPTEPESEARRAWRGLWAPKEKDKPKTKARAPKKRREWFKLVGPRQPLDQDAAWVYNGVGNLVARGDSEYAPVGRIMQMQASTVGEKVEQTVKGTPVDKVLQPIIQTAHEMEELANLVAWPVMTALGIRNPALLSLAVDRTTGEVIGLTGPLAMPYYSVCEANALAMADTYGREVVKKEQTRKKLMEIDWLREAVPADMDPVIWLIAQVFAPPPGPKAEDNGQVARAPAEHVA